MQSKSLKDIGGCPGTEKISAGRDRWRPLLQTAAHRWDGLAPNLDGVAQDPLRASPK